MVKGIDENRFSNKLITGISAITLYTADMKEAVSFYEALGFQLVYGGKTAAFTSFKAGDGFINLAQGKPPNEPWGRAIIYVSDVDMMYEIVCSAGFKTETSPRDAEWNERYFHVLDPDGNELSFAKPLL